MQTVQDAFEFAARLHSLLKSKGEQQAADDLQQTMGGFWTTSSEALGEMMDCLKRIRPTAVRALSKDVIDFLDDAIFDIRDILTGGYGRVDRRVWPE
jgi:hypothetical protein